MESKTYTGGDFMEFDKRFPLKLSKPLLKKVKWCDKVFVKHSSDNGYYEGYVVALNGGDMSNTMNQSIFGDQIELFMLPRRGYKFMQGLKTFWLCDIGIGKTKEEADTSFMKHDWFKRSKSKIQNDRFWAYNREQETK